MRRTSALAAVVVFGACSGDDKTDGCDLSATESQVRIEDRRVIGAAAPYAADLSLSARDEELRTSIAARRAAAWQVVEKVLAPVPFGDPRLAQSFGGNLPSLPAWHTWYGHDDFERVFKHLYRALTPAERRARASIDPAAGLAWNATALDGVPEWPEQRYLDYLATIDTPEEATGLGNVSRVGYSPGAMGHLLASYEQQHQCRLQPFPDAFDDDPVREGKPVAQTDAMSLTKCAWKELGPFVAGEGDVTITSSGSGDIDLYVRRGAAATASEHDCKSAGDSSTESCTVAGEGAIYVAVFAAEDSEATVEIAYTSADVRLPTCLDGEMPRDAVLVKADWRRQLGSETIPIFDTSANRMKSRFASASEWVSDGVAGPPSDQIYTAIIASSGARFRLPALHIMSKELDHWLWITLWWSASPNTDFGADRPASLAGPWKNYKMCVATDYLEGDPDPRGGQPGTLGDSLAAVSGGAGTPTWCSNPYLELGPGNAQTNCIGCHQHGGTDTSPETILTMPHRGSTRVRNNFFTDYLWAVRGGGGDDLSATVQAEVDFWDASDP
ncbi:MAG: PPC domain-containing protein [Myxococcales bacterium]|nr:PPC domain-containing protein [Myxococcales bacterium]